MQTEPNPSPPWLENNADSGGEPLPLVQKPEEVPKHDLRNPIQHLWQLGLDEDRPPLSYTTPGESLTLLRQDLQQQYHRVCNSLGAADGLGSFPLLDEGGGKILWPVDPALGLDPLQPSFQLQAGGQHRLLAGPHALLGANSWLGYELEQPLSALHAIGHQPGSHLKEAVAEIIRNTHLGGSRAGRRGGSNFKALPNHAKVPQLALTQGEGAEALVPLVRWPPSALFAVFYRSLSTAQLILRHGAFCRIQGDVERKRVKLANSKTG
ncbi:hypothetical protein DUNSADRAFT_15402 [Dunaliella salina]|uniref:Uncharacterized protein n=1 Tax=Dunaliella salina TaxID=3046 RepID=A0ABQ7G5H9_DUNSA|nr:hypothetical protein DUNSADRAFT_15402 [Dunaliella salina]|eukprot:KAF5829865.1 hypothetical protein DUNSADRAFT_15402 [Dunaliella salina]